MQVIARSLIVITSIGSLALSCKQRSNESSTVKGIDAAKGTVSQDGKSGVIEMSWPCGGNNRPNNMPDDKGNVFQGITQEEYCEWTQRSRITPTQRLRCDFSASFDSTRAMWMPQKAPAASPYRSVDGIVGMTFKGVRIERVGREDQSDFVKRLTPANRVRFNTQFNTYPALTALVRDCAVAGAICENVACVPDRTSDPLICRGVQTLVHTNGCKIALHDYSGPKSGALPIHAKFTANPKRLQILLAKRKNQLYSEGILSVEWHFRQVGAMQETEKLPDSIRQQIEKTLRGRGVLGPNSSLSAAQDFLNKKRTPVTVSREEGVAIIKAVLAHGDQKGRFNNFQQDTGYKMQLSIGSSIKPYCRHGIDPGAKGKLKSPDGTFVECIIPPKAKTADFIPINSCDDLADFIDIIARVDANSCNQSLGNMVDIEAAKVTPRPMSEVMRTFSNQNDAGAGARAGRQ